MGERPCNGALCFQELSPHDTAAISNYCELTVSCCLTFDAYIYIITMFITIHISLYLSLYMYMPCICQSNIFFSSNVHFVDQTCLYSVF